MATVEARRGQRTIAKPSGPAIAAVMAAMLALLAIALVNLGTEVSQPFTSLVHGVGKLWMPGAQGIGPYSGKETIALSVWLVSWAVLHLGLRKRQLDERVWAVLFLVGIGITTALLWPPVIGMIVG